MKTSFMFVRSLMMIASFFVAAHTASAAGEKKLAVAERESREVALTAQEAELLQELNLMFDISVEEVVASLETPVTAVMVYNHQGQLLMEGTTECTLPQGAELLMTTDGTAFYLVK